MTIQQLVYFREVAKTLNFTRASQNLNVTQSALSHAILSLERELELPLFVRAHGKQVEITRYGQALLPMAEEAIAQTDHITQTMRRLRTPNAGVVNIAFSYINCWQFAAALLRTFKEECAEQNILLQIHENHATYNFEEDVPRGIVDIAFSCLPEMEGLVTVPFRSQQLYAVLPAGHPLADRETLGLEELTEETLIGYHRGRNLDAWIQSHFERLGIKAPISEYTESWSTQLTRVSLGEGAAVMPMVPAPEGTVTFVPLRGEAGRRTVYMMWSAGRQLPPAVRYARDWLLEHRELTEERRGGDSV